MTGFVHSWADAARTSAEFFWMALWAFALGYLISSLIQVLVTRKRMQQAMGDTGVRSVAIGTFFGFISSSCSFSALSATRALFQKGAGLVPSLAFLLSSTNLVIELGIVIALFMSWQFVVGEYLGGLLLIGFAWLFVRLTRPKKLVADARERLRGEHGDDDDEADDWRQMLVSLDGWRQIGSKYVMEWQMVWRDVLIGFTVAGIIAAFVPEAFFEALFIGSGDAPGEQIGFLQVLAQTLIGPVAAFFTFIGSMGNIPLAALLFEHGVSFAGVMAFIFSDLVVLPVLRINARYYGWKMALYILLLLFACLVATALLLHYGLAAFDLLPDGKQAQSITERDAFKINYGFFLNLIALTLSAVLGWLWWGGRGAAGHDHDHGAGDQTLGDLVSKLFTILAAAWLLGGLVVAIALALLG